MLISIRLEIILSVKSLHRITMFNLYQQNRNAEKNQSNEAATTGHDRFYQERSSGSYRRKKRRGGCRRAQSSLEIHPTLSSSATALTKRAFFRMRSVSTDREESEEDNCENVPLVAQKIDSIVKLLFNKAIMGSPGSPVKNSPGEAESSPSLALMLVDMFSRLGRRSVESVAAASICQQYLADSTRYQFILHLNDIGSRPNKHWFSVRDKSIKAERLLTLVPLSRKCPIEPGLHSQGLILELFRALQHPYVYPVLDIAFCSDHVLAIIPYNVRGSIKDLIYKTCWSEYYLRKYENGSNGGGLPLWQVGRLGRQVLEGLLFLKEKGFPCFRHLHTGNIIVQNGVARISGLENTLVDATPRNQFLQLAPAQDAESLSLGYVLFEMCTGYELDEPFPQLGHLQLDLDQYPQVVEVLEAIFAAPAASARLHELLACELFRKIDLREMKGSCLPNFNQRLSGSCLSLLCAVERRSCGTNSFRAGLRSEGSSPMSTPPPRRRHYGDSTEEWQE